MKMRALNLLVVTKILNFGENNSLLDVMGSQRSNEDVCCGFFSAFSQMMPLLAGNNELLDVA